MHLPGWPLLLPYRVVAGAAAAVRQSGSVARAPVERGPRAHARGTVCWRRPRLALRRRVLRVVVVEVVVLVLAGAVGVVAAAPRPRLWGARARVRPVGGGPV